MKVPLLDLKPQYHALKPQIDAALLRVAESQHFILGPEVKSMAHRVMGRAWPYYCPDEHLTIPSLESIRRLVALSGGGRCELRRVNVHYSLRYLLRFLGMRAVPAQFDVLLPVPSGAFELFWPR